MICPNCNAEVSDSMKFCENCGAALPVSEPQQETAPAAEPAAQPAETAQPAAQQPMQQPIQPGVYAAPVAPAPAGPQPSSAPFVLAIIALVCAIFWLFPFSIILAIIALAMNSGQKKRGETSTKQTPTFVMSLISIIFSVLEIVAVALFGGLIWYAIQTGDFDDLTTSSSTSAITSTSSSTSSSTAEDASAYIGSWKLVNMVAAGEETGLEDLSALQDYGLEVGFEINEDGTAAFNLFGEDLTGTWEVASQDALLFEFEGQIVRAQIDPDTGELTLKQGDNQLTFAKK